MKQQLRLLELTFAPVAKKPNTIGGVVQGTVKHATGQNPITVNT